MYGGSAATTESWSSSKRARSSRTGARRVRNAATSSPPEVSFTAASATASSRRSTFSISCRSAR